MIFKRREANILKKMISVSKNTPFYFITSVTHDRLPIFRTDALKQVMCEALAAAAHRPRAAAQPQGKGNLNGKAQPFRTALRPSREELRRPAKARNHCNVFLKNKRLCPGGKSSSSAKTV